MIDQIGHPKIDLRINFLDQFNSKIDLMKQKIGLTKQNVGEGK